MTPEYRFTAKKKFKWWGEGEWVTEPDFYSFTHEGLECTIMRMGVLDGPGHIFGGNLNGYVCIPPNHPDFGMDYMVKDHGYEVHGGLTFAEYNDDKSVFSIGFDTAHSYDLVPSMISIRKQIKEEMGEKYPRLFANRTIFSGTYRNFEYVVNETKKLAEQVKARMP